MSEELKPCPFCGGAEIVLFNIRDGRRVSCATCGAAARQTFHGPNEDTDIRARAHWNTRATANGGWRPIAEEDKARGWLLASGFGRGGSKPWRWWLKLAWDHRIRLWIDEDGEEYAGECAPTHVMDAPLLEALPMIPQPPKEGEMLIPSQSNKK